MKNYAVNYTYPLNQYMFNGYTDMPNDKIDNNIDPLGNTVVARQQYRMYTIVLKQLSPIQKGIQAAHAIVEYSNSFSNLNDYQLWSKFDKTLIILESPNSSDMENVIRQLESNEYNYSIFIEESLDCITTAVSFIVPESIYSCVSIAEHGYANVGFLEKIIMSHHLAK